MTDLSDGGSGRGLLALWVALAVVFAFLVGIASGVLAWLGDHVVPDAVLTGGIAFGGTLTLCLVIIGLWGRR